MSEYSLSSVIDTQCLKICTEEATLTYSYRTIGILPVHAVLNSEPCSNMIIRSVPEDPEWKSACSLLIKLEVVIL